MGNVLVTDLVHELLLDGLAVAGFEVDYEPDIDCAKVINRISQYEGLIINSKILVDQEFLDRAVKLKFVGRLGSGMEIIDKVYAEKKGVSVFNSPEGNCNAVAEHALGMLLALSNNLIKANQEVKNFTWNREQNRGFEIEGKSIGIIGYGHTGTAFSKKLFSWEVEILVYDKYKENIDTHNNRIKLVSKEDLLKNAQIISFHLPLTSETRYFANEAFLNEWANPLVLINASRGKIVDTNALIDFIESGKLKGACLDVFENEKPTTYSIQEIETYKRLFKFENIVVSPHIAGWTVESKEKLSKILLDKILFLYHK